MLRIRTAEKQALEVDQREAYFDRVLRILAESWPKEVATLGPSVKDLLRSWTNVLASHGVETEKPLAQALNVFFAVLVDFGEDPITCSMVTAALGPPPPAQGGSESSKAYRLEAALFERYAAPCPSEALQSL